MEILTLILKRRVRLSDSFRYHHYSEEIQLINVCFADDLFIFARGDVESSRVIMDSLEEFKMTSGLIPNIPKSTAYFCNVLYHTKVAILSIMPFSEGELPVKYLGVPIISSGLLNRDCKILVEKNIISSKESLWVRWIHTYKLRGRTIWDVPIKDEMSWGWRKLLQLWDIMRPFFWVKLGNGKAPDLGLFTCPALVSSKADLWQWCDRYGNASSFSVAKAWEAIRPRGNLVAWSWIVWFSHNTPRRAFHLWLVMRNGLKTHYKMRQWDVGGMDLIPPVLEDILLYLIPMGNKRTARSIFGELILAASAYFIWMERNNRTFKNTRRSPKEIRDLIMVTVSNVIFSGFADLEDVGRIGCSSQKIQVRVVLFFPSSRFFLVAEGATLVKQADAASNKEGK
ncbi:reverse transcriptase domain, reverse transcriptase zinc-binding domain protein [Tanacetum coccineum]